MIAHGIFTGAVVVAAAVISFVVVYVVRNWATRHGVLDCPNERSSHTGMTPRGGGLGIVGVTVAGASAAWWFEPTRAMAVVAGPLVGAVLIAVVSWLDDLHSLPTSVRLFTHAVAAVAVVTSAGPWRVLAVPPLGVIDLGWVGWPLTLLWIVGLTNAYNFMDGIDGLAAGQAIVAGIAWTALGALDGQPMVTVCGALLAGSSAGFLAHNWPPAKIFMGDVGSAFLGYAFATLTVLAARAQPLDALSGALLVWPFVFDATFTFGRRLLRGERVFAAHRSHLYQRLVMTGLPHLTVSALYCGLALLGALLAGGLRSGSTATATGWPVVILLAATWLWTQTVRREGQLGKY